MQNTVIRKATESDMDSIMNMIQELANFEKMPDGPKINAEVLQRDVNSNIFMCHVAETNNQVVGYAIYYFIYSTWTGRCMFLEDIYVKPDSRKQGIGKKLFQAVVEETKKNNCCRLDFHVLSWNPATQFYEALGASNLTDSEKWNCFRLEKEKFDSVLE